MDLFIKNKTLINLIYLFIDIRAKRLTFRREPTRREQTRGEQVIGAKLPGTFIAPYPAGSYYAF